MRISWDGGVPFLRCPPPLPTQAKKTGLGHDPPAPKESPVFQGGGEVSNSRFPLAQVQPHSHPPPSQPHENAREGMRGARAAGTGERSRQREAAGKENSRERKRHSCQGSLSRACPSPWPARCPRGIPSLRPSSRASLPGIRGWEESEEPGCLSRRLAFPPMEKKRRRLLNFVPCPLFRPSVSRPTLRPLRPFPPGWIGNPASSPFLPSRLPPPYFAGGTTGN